MKKFHIAEPFTARPFRVPHFCSIIFRLKRRAYSSPRPFCVDDSLLAFYGWERLFSHRRQIVVYNNVQFGLISHSSKDLV